MNDYFTHWIIALLCIMCTLPIADPTLIPTSAPTDIPTFPPSTTDTNTLSVLISFSATAPPTQTDEDKLRLRIQNHTHGVNNTLMSLHNFDVSHTSTSRRLNMRVSSGRHLLAAASWQVTFDLILSLSETGETTFEDYQAKYEASLNETSFQSGILSAIPSITAFDTITSSIVTRSPTTVPVHTPTTTTEKNDDGDDSNGLNTVSIIRLVLLVFLGVTLFGVLSVYIIHQKSEIDKKYNTIKSRSHLQPLTKLHPHKTVNKPTLQLASISHTNTEHRQIDMAIKREATKDQQHSQYPPAPPSDLSSPSSSLSSRKKNRGPSDIDAPPPSHPLSTPDELNPDESPKLGTSSSGGVVTDEEKEERNNTGTEGNQPGATQNNQPVAAARPYPVNRNDTVEIVGDAPYVVGKSLDSVIPPNELTSTSADLVVKTVAKNKKTKNKKVKGKISSSTTTSRNSRPTLVRKTSEAGGGSINNDSASSISSKTSSLAVTRTATKADKMKTTPTSTTSVANTASANSKRGSSRAASKSSVKSSPDKISSENKSNGTSSNGVPPLDTSSLGTSLDDETLRTKSTTASSGVPTTSVVNGSHVSINTGSSPQRKKKGVAAISSVSKNTSINVVEDV